MSSPLTSVLLGFFYLIVTFVSCLLFVAGVKVIYHSIKQYVKPQKPVVATPETKKIRKPRKPYKPVRSIEINPDEVDKIYVKKIS